ncbi:hypothetical protein [Ancylobacter lacus]|uniref:hypothetical protein n=1 Tax=Ancylobacter lacus TaxID=2579970 RepID=UPI001BCF0234|nr:hypothetical protein [Ancylobacter lacus]MBS7537339.1 hypothetical protein [Ancylobacter lacus]
MNRLLLRLLLLPLKVLIGALVLLDEVARPLYRPLGRWIASLRLMQRFERFVARQPRLVILLLLGIPFAIAEPVKIVAVFWMAEDGFWSGLLMLCTAYLISFVVVERVFNAGRAKLTTYGWFAFGLAVFEAWREALFRWLRATWAWSFIQKVKLGARRLARRVLSGASLSPRRK